jgi:hypothetical protein
MNAVTAIDRPVQLDRLRGFVTASADLLAITRDEGAILQSGAALLTRLSGRAVGRPRNWRAMPGSGKSCSTGSILPLWRRLVTSSRPLPSKGSMVKRSTSTR